MSRLADEAMYFGAVADGVESQQEEIAALRQQLAEFKHGQDAYQQLFNNEKAKTLPGSVSKLRCTLAQTNAEVSGGL